MNKTAIPWCDYTINPVKGLCPMACPYCYARRLYKRFKWNPEIRMENYDYWRFPAGSKVFIGSTIELFGNWIDPAWMQEIFCECSYLPNTTFIFLTKQPQNLIQWSPFPSNVWVGVSATNTQMLMQGCSDLEDVRAKVKFLSVEPLLDWSYSWTESYLINALNRAKIKWLIIGAQTPRSKKTFPKWEWVKEIIDAADKANIPVFLKDNLGLPRLSCESGMPYYKPDSGTMKLRQEFPVKSKG
jgi:protein gp37